MKRAVVFRWTFGAGNLAHRCGKPRLIRREVRLRHRPTPAASRQQEGSANHAEQQFRFHGPTKIEVRCCIAFAALAPTAGAILGKRTARKEEQQAGQKDHVERSHSILLLASLEENLEESGFPRGQNSREVGSHK
jgi:hypothetical protein